MESRIVTLLTDFGTRDWFVGVVRGVILARAPGVQVVDLSHHVPPGDVNTAAVMLEVAAPEFPAGTVHVAVVDPGVGTSRRALCVAAAGQLFLGPDNGILEAGLAAPDAQAFELSEERYFRLPLSRTFHARDVFAPIAAALCVGVEARALGPPVRDAARLERQNSERRDAELWGRVAYIDHFGNCLTNLSEEAITQAFPGTPPQDLQVVIGTHLLRGLSESYSGVPRGTLLALIGSTGRLEVAQFGTHAASRLGAAVGDVVRVRVKGSGLPPPDPIMEG